MVHLVRVAQGEVRHRVLERQNFPEDLLVAAVHLRPVPTTAPAEEAEEEPAVPLLMVREALPVERAPQLLPQAQAAQAAREGRRVVAQEAAPEPEAT